jgi:hypothetical protein
LRISKRVHDAKRVQLLLHISTPKLFCFSAVLDSIFRVLSVGASRTSTSQMSDMGAEHKSNNMGTEMVPKKLKRQIWCLVCDFELVDCILAFDLIYNQWHLHCKSWEPAEFQTIAARFGRRKAKSKGAYTQFSWPGCFRTPYGVRLCLLVCISLSSRMIPGCPFWFGVVELELIACFETADTVKGIVECEIVLFFFHRRFGQL